MNTNRRVERILIISLQKHLGSRYDFKFCWLIHGNISCHKRGQEGLHFFPLGLVFWPFK